MSEDTPSRFSMVSQPRLLLCYEWPSSHTSLDQSAMTVPRVTTIWRSSVGSQPWLLLCWVTTASLLHSQSTVATDVTWITAVNHFLMLSQPRLSPSSDASLWSVSHGWYCAESHHCLTSLWSVSHACYCSESPPSDTCLWSVSHGPYCADSHHHLMLLCGQSAMPVTVLSHHHMTLVCGQSAMTVTVLTVTVIWCFSVVSQPWLVLCWESPLSHFSVVSQP